MEVSPSLKTQTKQPEHLVHKMCSAVMCECCGNIVQVIQGEEGADFVKFDEAMGHDCFTENNVLKSVTSAEHYMSFEGLSSHLRRSLSFLVVITFPLGENIWARLRVLALPCYLFLEK